MLLLSSSVVMAFIIVLCCSRKRKKAIKVRSPLSLCSLLFGLREFSLLQRLEKNHVFANVVNMFKIFHL